MTRTPHRSRSLARRGAVGAAVLLGSLLAVDGGVDASARTSSERIAAEAGRALDAFDRWQEDRNPADYVRFVQGRETTATMTADDLEVDPAALRQVWASAPVEKQQAVLAALSQLGVPYRSITSKPGIGFDCSGLTIWAFRQAGLELPRVSRDQIRASEEIDHSDAEPGDLVYYPGHISIYLGLDTIVHSPNSGHDVEAAPLFDRSLRFGDAFAGD